MMDECFVSGYDLRKFDTQFEEEDLVCLLFACLLVFSGWMALCDFLWFWTCALKV